MPYDKLNARLKALTGGRIVRGDGDPAAEQAAFRQAGSLLRLGYASADSNPLWAELTLDVM
jgi:hypothetical protein